MQDGGLTVDPIPSARSSACANSSKKTADVRKMMSAAQAQKTILLADDAEMVRNACRRMLERFGYQVITAEDGMQALDIYKRRFHEIDLVILDMIMPNLDGRKTLYEMKKIHASVKALIFSGELPADELRSTLNDGFIGYISKPFDLAKMLAILKKSLH